MLYDNMIDWEHAQSSLQQMIWLMFDTYISSKAVQYNVSSVFSNSLLSLLALLTAVSFEVSLGFKAVWFGTIIFLTAALVTT